MARVYQWYTAMDLTAGSAIGDVESVDLLGGDAVAGATVIRAICYLTAAGALSSSPQFPIWVAAGLQVRTGAPADPFESPALEETDWLWIGADPLRAGTDDATTVISTDSTGFQAGIQTRASRVLGSGESVWLSYALPFNASGGTWNANYLTRVLCLLPDA